MTRTQAVSRIARNTTGRWKWLLVVLLIIGPSFWYWQGGRSVQKEQEFEITCREAIEDRDWSKLIETGAEWSEWNPDAADAWLYQSHGFQEQGNVDQAAELLLQLRDDSEKTEAALLVAASLYFEQLGQPLKAVPVLKRLLSLNATSITAHQRLIFFYGITLQRVKMIDQIRAAIEVGAEPPDAYVYLHLAGRLSFSNGYMMNQRWLRNAPGNRLFRIAAAIQLSAARDQAETADEEAPEDKASRHDEIRKLLTEYPEDTALLRYLLHLAVEKDDPDRVGELLANAPEQAWDDSVFWRFRGWYHYRFAEYSEAENAFRKSLELYPQDWKTWHQLAATLRKQKKLDEAEQTQRIALRGKELRKKILQLPDARAVTPQILEMMRDYCDACGDPLTASSLQTRIQMNGRY